MENQEELEELRKIRISNTKRTIAFIVFLALMSSACLFFLYHNNATSFREGYMYCYNGRLK